MKDEIKEILFLLHNDRLTESGKRKLEDYITNLQEELKSANESITWWNNRFNTIQEQNKELKEINCEFASEGDINLQEIEWLGKSIELAIDYLHKVEKRIDKDIQEKLLKILKEAIHVK